MAAGAALDPLMTIIPDPRDQLQWSVGGQVLAADTGAAVWCYRHGPSGRSLRLDALGRVYGQDAQGTVRLFGKGGPLALAVALNAVFDGFDGARPRRIVLPGADGAPATVQVGG